MDASYINAYLFDGSESSQGYVPEIINGIPEEYYDIYYKEDYTDGANGWWTGSQTSDNGYDLTGEVLNGHYNLYYNTYEYAMWVSMVSNFPAIDLESYDNFDFKIRYKYINDHSSQTNAPSSFYGFFGKPEPNIISKYFGIRINDEQEIFSRIGEHTGHDWSNWNTQEVTNFNFNFTTQTSEYNVLVLRKINRKFYLFVNDELLNVEQRESFHMGGNRFGFIISNADVAIDEIEIKRIILN